MRIAQSFVWSTLGSVTTVTGDYYPTIAEAWANTLPAAQRMGWTPPRWYQWWRWDDQPRGLLPGAETDKWQMMMVKILRALVSPLFVKVPGWAILAYALLLYLTFRVMR